MSEMVERMVAAFCAWHHAGRREPLCSEPCEDCPEMARVALEAMREPSEAMARVGEDVSAHFISRGYSSPPVEAWRAMIDAALSDQPPIQPPPPRP